VTGITDRGEEPRRIAVVRFRNRGVIATATNRLHIVVAAGRHVERRTEFCFVVTVI
jgi:hypothetical protein